MKAMRQIFTQGPPAPKPVVVESETIHADPDDLDFDHADYARLRESRQFQASPDGRFVAKVIRADDGGFLLIHSHASLPSAPFVPEEGKGAPKILAVSEHGVLVWASRPGETGLFEVGETIVFQAELERFDGLVDAEPKIAYGIHPVDGGPLRRRFVWIGTWRVIDEPLYHDRVTGAWHAAETGMLVLPDGVTIASRKTNKGWERLCLKDGACERVPLPYAAAVRSHLLGATTVDLLNDGGTYRVLLGGRLVGVHPGAVDRSWQSPDGSKLLILEAWPTQHDPEAEHAGPLRQLIEMDADGVRRKALLGRFCIEPDGIVWAASAYAAVIRRFEGMRETFATYREFIHTSASMNVLVPLGERVGEMLLDPDGSLAAFVVSDDSASRVVVRGTSFGPHMYVYNLSRTPEGVAFNAMDGHLTRRIAVT
jgi:hypothetical protein